MLIKHILLMRIQFGEQLPVLQALSVPLSSPAARMEGRGMWLCRFGSLPFALESFSQSSWGVPVWISRTGERANPVMGWDIPQGDVEKSQINERARGGVKGGPSLPRELLQVSVQVQGSVLQQPCCFAAVQVKGRIAGR